MFGEWLFKKSHPVLQFALLFVRTVTTPDFRREIHPLSLFGSFPCDQLNSSCSRFAKDSGDLASVAGISEGFLKWQNGSFALSWHFHQWWIFMKCPQWGCLPVLNPDKREVFFYSIVGEGSVIWLTMFLLTSERLPFPGKNKMSFCKGKSKVSANT